jgi:multiple sugar transport system substrate-binding protein
VRLSRRGRFAGVAAAGLLLLAGCGGDGGGTSGDYPDPGDGTGEIQVWAKQGQESEVNALEKAVKDFEAANPDVTVKLQLIAEGTYAQTLTTTNVDQLPDALMIGGENMAAHVYAGKLRPLDDLLPQATIDNMISSVIAQGTYTDGMLYAVGQFDSGLALYGNKSLLDAAGVAYPTTVDGAWTFAEFKDAVMKLADKDKDGKSLSIEENYAGQWPGYAFTPIVNSAGQPLVQDGSADGHLNAPEVAAALDDFATLRQYTDANADDLAFNDARVGLAWVGHWMYNTYDEALGSDLVVIPLPDFGNGTKSGQGSNAWSVSSNSEKAAAAAKFVDFLMQDAQVKEMTDGNGAPPGTTSVTAQSDLYKPGGPLELYSAQLSMTCGSAPPTPDCVTVPRTISPAWPVINDSFSKAFWAIWQGGNAQSQLDGAAKVIDLDYADNAGYE